MFDMLQLVVKITYTQANKKRTTKCPTSFSWSSRYTSLSVENHYDKLKHVGHLVV
jgi:hypothetical protein